jgi:hypothetical protein
MKLLPLLSLLILVGALDAYGQSPEVATTNPFVQFTDRLLKERGDALWIPDAPKAPPGGYLYRFSLPSGSEGAPFVFVSSSLCSTEKSDTWTVFQQTKDNQWKIIRDKLTLPPTAIAAKKEDNRVVYTTVGPETKEGRRIVSFGASSSEADKLEVKDRLLSQKEEKAVAAVEQSWSGAATTSEPEVKTAQKQLQWQPVSVEIEKTVLSTFLENKEPAWKPISTDFSLVDQYRDVRDSDEINKAVAEHPQVSHETEAAPKDQ